MQKANKKILNGCYQYISSLGQGNFGTVGLYIRQNQKKKNILNDFFYGSEEKKQQYFALKKYKSEYSKDKEGIHFSTLRQINFLMSIKHKNIASGHQVIVSKNKNGQFQVYVVLDFYVQLKDILDSLLIVRNNQHKKYICYQILQGIGFLHKNYIMHRDLKPENIFVSKNGQIKISDFGFAKQFGSPYGKYTANTCTKQYRAPQLFFGTHYYTQKSDIWSFGCIIYFIFKKKHLFFSDFNQDLQILARIFHLRGTPNRKTWPNFDKFPDFLKFEDTEQKNIQKQLQLPQQVAKIIQSCLQLNPALRPSVNQLLQNQFFDQIRQKHIQLEYLEQFYHDKLQKIMNNKNFQENEQDLQVQI